MNSIPYDKLKRIMTKLKKKKKNDFNDQHDDESLKYIHLRRKGSIKTSKKEHHISRGSTATISLVNVKKFIGNK